LILAPPRALRRTEAPKVTFTEKISQEGNGELSEKNGRIHARNNGFLRAMPKRPKRETAPTQRGWAKKAQQDEG
jgi:hypothetical protein